MDENFLIKLWQVKYICRGLEKCTGQMNEFHVGSERHLLIRICGTGEGTDPGVNYRFRGIALRGPRAHHLRVWPWTLSNVGNMILWANLMERSLSQTSEAVSSVDGHRPRLHFVLSATLQSYDKCLPSQIICL